MKKVITLILVTFMATMLLPNCSSSSKAAELQQEQQNISEVDELWQEVIELRKEVDNLHSELSQLKEQMSNTQSTTQNAELLEAPAETSKSSKNATEESLLRAANQCADIESMSSATELARRICDNSDATGVVIKQLAYSNFPAVWNIAARSTHADEDALIALAKECAKIETIRLYDWAEKVATSICGNPAATGAVIKELTYSRFTAVLNIAARSTHADEDALIALAKQCNGTELAISICNNPATTGAVIKQLAYSNYPAVWNVAAQSTHADEDALIVIAKKCAGITEGLVYSNRDAAKTLATSICENPAITSRVLKELAKSSYTSVTTMAREKMEELQ